MSNPDPFAFYKAELDNVAVADTLTPSERYQELFVAVQMERVFKDSKTFVDCSPTHYPEHILSAYRAQRADPDFDLRQFIDEHFSRFELSPRKFVSDPDRSLSEHIDHLWRVLTRHPQAHPAGSSLLPLPFDYVVPGGRFTEIYYWDSYFTMLGLDESGCQDLLRAMADNFAYLIDTYGHVPNGNRTYYLSRSQPPVFVLMTELFEEKGIRRASDYLPQLHREYDFWMDGADRLRPGECHRRCVRLPDGALLNRYWDDRDTPRDESYCEDVETAKGGDRPVHEVYRDLRAACESGWDFSSRWLADPTRLDSIRTTAILPVDLNSLLYRLERQIADLSELKGDPITHTEFGERAEARRAAMDRYLWRPQEGAYFDYDWQLQCSRDNLTAATLTPLFVQVASAEQASCVAEVVRERLLAPGGLATTVVEAGNEQWDRPNGWAPLQWIGIRGLERYGHDELAKEIESRWLKLVSDLFERESKLVEKYVLRSSAEHAGGGEYPLQDGFGWTNGVTRRLMQEDPTHPANRCRAGHCAPSSDRA